MRPAEFYERKGSPLVAGRFISEFKRLVSLLREHPQMEYDPAEDLSSGESIAIFISEAFATGDAGYIAALSPVPKVCRR